MFGMGVVLLFLGGWLETKTEKTGQFISLAALFLMVNGILCTFIHILFLALISVAVAIYFGLNDGAE